MLVNTYYVDKYKNVNIIFTHNGSRNIVKLNDHMSFIVGFSFAGLVATCRLIDLRFEIWNFSFSYFLYCSSRGPLHMHVLNTPSPLTTVTNNYLSRSK